MIITKQIQGIIKQHQKAAKREYPQWDKYRLWYQARWGGAEPLPSGSTPMMLTATSVYTDQDVTDDAAGDSIETNYPYAYVDTMVANVVPPNPAVTVNARRKDNKTIGKARETLIVDTFRQQRLHSKLWALATRASVFPRAFIKASWDMRKGRPRYRVIDPRFVWFDMGADSWEDVRYIIEVVPLTKEQFNRRVRGPEDKEGYDPDVVERVSKAWTRGLPDWLKDKSNGKTDTVSPGAEVFDTILVYEFYDFTVPEGRFVTVIEGIEEPLFDGQLPYRFLPNPFRMLTFNDNLDDLGGMSDIQLVEGLINQANELDVLDLNFNKTAIPQAWINMSVLKDPAAALKAFGEAGQPGSYVPLDVDKGVPLDQVIMFTPTPTLNPAHMRMENRLEDKILYILATPKYSRGSVGSGDVATEFALADSATRTRNARRQAEVYDVVSWLGEATIALYEEYLKQAEVLYARVLGVDAISELDRETLGMQAIEVGEGGAAQFVGERMLFDYEAVPYNATENNKTMQLRSLQQVWPVLQFGITKGSIDEKRILRKILETIQMEDVFVETEPAPPQVPPVAPGAVATQEPDLLALPDLEAPLGGGAVGVDRADTAPFMQNGGPGHGGEA